MINIEIKKGLPSSLKQIATDNCPKCDTKLEYLYNDIGWVEYCKSCWHYCESKIIKDHCNHETIYVQKMIANGVVIREQCTKCFMVGGQSIKRSNFDDWKKLPVVTNVENFEVGVNKLWNAKKRYWDKSRALSNYKRPIEYNEHISSSAWKVKRKLVLQRDNFLCQDCLVAKATDVHHLSYEHFKNEPLFELIGVCRPCHESLHNMEKKEKYKPINHSK